MDAVVQLKVAPAEFDLIRRALGAYVEAKLAEGDGQGNDPAARREAKAEALRAKDALERLQ